VCAILGEVEVSINATVKQYVGPIVEDEEMACSSMQSHGHDQSDFDFHADYNRVLIKLRTLDNKREL
jgi:hypothetical protein